MATKSPLAVTRTAALVLAYLHRYPVTVLPGRGMAAVHLRQLAHWIGQPSPRLRSIRAHPLLAGHLVLLRAAGLLSQKGGRWTCSPPVFAWLKADAVDQITLLLEGSTSTEKWETAARELALQEIAAIDVAVYLQQSLTREREESQLTEANRLSKQAKDSRFPSIAYAAWLPDPSPEEWRLRVPDTLSIEETFHLLQLGHWQPGHAVHCTPLSIGEAVQRGYSQPTIESLLARATGQPLPEARRQQLAEWLKRLDAYRLYPVYLLSAAQPEQLAEIAANRRLRRRFQYQIASRHAVVSPRLVAPLRRWLRQKNFLLNAPEDPAEAESPTPDAAYAWLGLRLLAGLADFVELPLSLPDAALESFAAQLDPQQQAELDAAAHHLLQGLREVIRGRDAFFPALAPPDDNWLDQIGRAIMAESRLEIEYQSPADYQPRYRSIQPLRLERQGELYYLHAYCYRAEANLVFRLDRISRLWLSNDQD